MFNERQRSRQAATRVRFGDRSLIVVVEVVVDLHDEPAAPDAERRTGTRRRRRDELHHTEGRRRRTPASFEVQAEQVLANVQAALEGAGSSVAQLVQVRVYIVDVEHWMSFNQIYARWAGEARPARTVVPVPQLHYGFRIEVEATALVAAR